VYTYPADWNGTEPDDPVGTGEVPSRGDSEGALRADSGGGLRGDFGGDDPRPVRSLDTFFLRPLPAWKRGLDILGALAGLAILSPLFAVVAAGIKLTSPGPVVFTQRRSGLGGRPFLIVKFRTMVDGAERRQRELLALNEQDGPAFKIAADPRVTRFGRLLRSTSIDELPQLWNVLRGDMSLVGPRPLPCHESRACLPWQRRRLDVTPGLTCIWQVRGRSRVSFDEWVRMDVEYIKARSLSMDLKLLCLTLPAVLRREGAC
jgi:lipopolysaccharide/colanic/teichoic acid biosynthesis glycosyltransferase